MSMNMHMQLHTHCICNILYLDPLKITTFSVNRLDMVPFDTSSHILLLIQTYSNWKTKLSLYSCMFSGSSGLLYLKVTVKNQVNTDITSPLRYTAMGLCFP